MVAVRILNVSTDEDSSSSPKRSSFQYFPSMILNEIRSQRANGI